MNKWVSSVVLSSLIGQPHAGVDLIFRDGFQSTAPEIFCPNALPLTVQNDPEGIPEQYYALDTIDPAGSKKFFTVELDAQEWVYFYASANGFESPIIPAISLFTADGSQMLAQNTEQFLFSTGFGYKTINSGVHCIMVEDYSTFSGATPQGGPEYEFQIVTVLINFEDNDYFNLDVEPNNSTNSPQTGLTQFNLGGVNNEFTAGIMGEFNDVNDTDVYLITTSDSAKTLTLSTSPAGPTGSGHTVVYSLLEIIDGNSLEVLSRVSPDIGVAEIQMPVTANTDYFIRVSQPSTPLGDNPFYVLDWKTVDNENQQESNDINNNTSAGAEQAINTVISPSANFFYYIAGELTGISDIDWWEFEVEDGHTMNLFCNSSHIGSGVSDGTFSVFDNPVSSALQLETESPFSGINWSTQTEATNPPIVMTSSNNHFLKIEANNFSNSNQGRYYICGVIVLQPL